MSGGQVVVVGAGPAGLSAAIAAAEAGASTLLIDERDQPGGQLPYRRTPVVSALDGPLAPQELLVRLVARALAAKVTIELKSTAWGLFPDAKITISNGTLSRVVEAEQLILATGSTDLALPFSGATLPGVFTARAVLLLLNHYAVRPGSRYVLLGQGPVLTELAESIRLTGGTVVTEFDPAGDLNLVVAHGERELNGVSLAGQDYAADVLVVAPGRQPDNALAIMAGCDMVYDPGLGGWVPLRDDELRATAKKVRIAGDAAGCTGIATAMAEGACAGRWAAGAAGYTSAVVSDDELPERLKTRIAASLDLVPIHRQHVTR